MNLKWRRKKDEQECAEERTHPREWYNVEARPSLIHGIGGFAKVEIKEGEEIFEDPIGWRGINHSDNPNSKHVGPEGGDMRLIATRDIKKDEEITITYVGWKPLAVFHMCATLKQYFSRKECMADEE